MGPKRSKSSLQPPAKKARTATNADDTLAQLSASITAQVLDNLKESGLIFNTSQQSVPNEPTGTCNLTSIPSSSVDTSDSLNEQSSRPSTSAIQAVPVATTSLAATSAPTPNASNVSLPYITGINPHVYTQTFINDNNPFNAPVASYKPLNRPLYTRVSSKLRDKILSNQYIDMSEILEEPVTYAEEEILPFGMNRYGQVGVCPTKKPKKKLTIESWTDAFSIYSSVLRQASSNPSKLAEELATYMYFIRSIYKDNGKWYNYDTTFRSLKAQDSTMQWNEIDHLLYPQALLKKDNYHAAQPSAFIQRSNQPFLGCFQYNKAKECDGTCGYPHICLLCGKRHPKKFCKRNRTRQGNSNNYTNTSGYNSITPSGNNTRPVTSNPPARSTAVKPQSK